MFRRAAMLGVECGHATSFGALALGSTFQEKAQLLADHLFFERPAKNQVRLGFETKGNTVLRRVMEQEDDLCRSGCLESTAPLVPLLLPSAYLDQHALVLVG